MSGGGKGGGSVVVGYKYSMGVQLAVCHGPVDAVTELIIGERQAWTGNVTSNNTIFVDKPNLFGGESREGGVRGNIDINMGGSTQGVNSYLSSRISGPVPAYRGLLTTVFRQFLWSSGNPYFKTPWWRIRRITAGWSRGAPWYTARAQIGSHDMNPAHIIYECLTNLEWGMGYPVNAIDNASFTAAADQLHSEGFGLSLMWMEQTSIEDFIQLVLRHFDGILRIDLKTGRFQLKMIRADYNVSTLPELNKDNIIALESFQRSAWGDTANEVVVKYTDREQNETTIAVQDLASIEAQGGLVSTTREYPGIRSAALATRVAMRDLNNVSIPLARVTLKVNRVAWGWDIGDVFKLTWPKLGVQGVPFRILEVNKGSLANGVITISAIEDVFGMPSAAYIQPEPSSWVDPINDPQPVNFARAFEVPYYDAVRTIPAGEFNALPSDWAFGEVMAIRPTNDAYGFELRATPTTTNYQFVNSCTFIASATLADAMPIGGTQITFTVMNAFDIDMVDTSTYFYINNEAFGIVSINAGTGQITATRGVLDTLPAAHAAGARLYFSQGHGIDPTTRATGELTRYKALTRTGKGLLAESSAPVISIAFTGRAHRPYPPANFTINGQRFPVKTYGSGLNLAWAHRDRLMQTVSLTPHTTGNIGPEIGTEYILRLYNGNGGSLIRTYTLTGTTWNYPEDATDGYRQDLRIELESRVGTTVSWQRYNQEIKRHGLGFRLGEDLGGVAQ